MSELFSNGRSVSTQHPRHANRYWRRPARWVFVSIFVIGVGTDGFAQSLGTLFNGESNIGAGLMGARRDVYDPSKPMGAPIDIPTVTASPGVPAPPPSDGSSVDFVGNRYDINGTLISPAAPYVPSSTPSKAPERAPAPAGYHYEITPLKPNILGLKDSVSLVPDADNFGPKATTTTPTTRAPTPSVPAVTGFGDPKSPAPKSPTATSAAPILPAPSTSTSTPLAPKSLASKSPAPATPTSAGSVSKSSAAPSAAPKVAAPVVSSLSPSVSTPVRVPAPAPMALPKTPAPSVTVLAPPTRAPAPSVSVSPPPRVAAPSVTPYVPPPRAAVTGFAYTPPPPAISAQPRGVRVDPVPQGQTKDLSDVRRDVLRLQQNF